ncbi:hypothetical protein ACYULU_02865 [Breznakiellaceae bacterium SP9]
MQVYENIRENERGEFVTDDGRIFRPLYKGMLDKMPQDIVHELAKRRLKELEAASESDSKVQR